MRGFRAPILNIVVNQDQFVHTVIFATVARNFIQLYPRHNHVQCLKPSSCYIAIVLVLLEYGCYGNLSHEVFVDDQDLIHSKVSVWKVCRIVF